MKKHQDCSARSCQFCLNVGLVFTVFFRTRTIPCVIAPQAQLSWDMLLLSEKEILTGKRDEPSHGGYDELFRNADITSDEGRVCVLNQHPVKHPTTSHSDGSLPTFLSAGNQKIWSYARQRWLTATEKWVAMGWPGNPLSAKLLNRPLANALACQGHERIGNGMHVFNVVLVLLSLMASIELAPVEPAKAGHVAVKHMCNLHILVNMIQYVLYLCLSRCQDSGQIRVFNQSSRQALTNAAELQDGKMMMQRLRLRSHLLCFVGCKSYQMFLPFVK